MKDMTQEEALAEAVRRWGPLATIQFRSPRATRDNPGRLARYCCTVSNGGPRPFDSVEGQGRTWVEAFADAEVR